MSVAVLIVHNLNKALSPLSYRKLSISTTLEPVHSTTKQVQTATQVNVREEHMHM